MKINEPSRDEVCRRMVESVGPGEWYPEVFIRPDSDKGKSAHVIFFPHISVFPCPAHKGWFTQGGGENSICKFSVKPFKQIYPALGVIAHPCTPTSTGRILEVFGQN